VPSEPPAKFFVNSGLVSSRADIGHLLRPILKQTVSYRYFRGRDLVSHGTGWVERIVSDEPLMSTYFTPISITINVDSFEHLEFETRPDQSAPARVRHQRLRPDGADGARGDGGVGAQPARLAARQRPPGAG
jgi:hypothetical protein